MRILGLETSCDETAVAVYDDRSGLIAHAVHSQTAVHAEFGGVVPELASRDHIRKITPMIRQLLSEASLTLAELDGVAYTAGPGLVGALLVGAAVGRSLAFALGVPAIGVHHMEAHLLSPLLEPDAPDFPLLALLVSGGHTQIVAVHSLGDYRLLGESVDDAVGEAFDKTAKLLGLPYPGGPALAELAERGDPKRFRFPRPMANRRGLDMSFSGLKTHAMTTLTANGDDARTRADVARAFEEAAVDTLTIKCRLAIRETGFKRLIVAGGVGANRRLREALTELARAEGTTVRYPRVEFCTDNAAMVALAGCLRLMGGEREPLCFPVRARWPLAELQSPHPLA